VRDYGQVGSATVRDYVIFRGTQEGGREVYIWGGSGRRRADGTANGAACRAEERRERAAPVLGTVLGAVLGVVKPVTLRVGPGREVGRDAKQMRRRRIVALAALEAAVWLHLYLRLGV
jgi:hypothetical protein